MNRNTSSAYTDSPIVSKKPNETWYTCVPFLGFWFPTSSLCSQVVVPNHCMRPPPGNLVPRRAPTLSRRRSQSLYARSTMGIWFPTPSLRLCAFFHHNGDAAPSWKSCSPCLPCTITPSFTAMDERRRNKLWRWNTISPPTSSNLHLTDVSLLVESLARGLWNTLNLDPVIDDWRIHELRSIKWDDALN